MKLIMFICLLLLYSQYFREVQKKVKSFSGTVQNDRSLARIPHLVSVYLLEQIQDIGLQSSTSGQEKTLIMHHDYFLYLTA